MPPQPATSARIRLAEADDQAAVVACVEAAFGVLIRQIGKPPSPMLADYGALIGTGQVHVLEDRGIVGVLVIEPRAAGLFVETLAIDPARQREGLGCRLMAFAEAAARRQGRVAVELYTNAVMTGALGLYRALGYHEIRRRHEDGYARVYLRKPVAGER
jgi:ribosomal protein S18 acetylase RimI-like enzyme